MNDPLCTSGCVWCSYRLQQADKYRHINHKNVEDEIKGKKPTALRETLNHLVDILIKKKKKKDTHFDFWENWHS